MPPETVGPAPKPDPFEDAAAIQSKVLELEELVALARAQGWELELEPDVYARAVRISKSLDSEHKVRHPAFALTEVAKVEGAE